MIIKQYNKNVSAFGVISVPTDGLAPVGARTSAASVATKFISSKRTGPTFDGLIFQSRLAI